MSVTTADRHGRIPQARNRGLKDIGDEEGVHAGEFLRLFREPAPDEEKFYSEGAREVEEEIEKSK